MESSGRLAGFDRLRFSTLPVPSVLPYRIVTRSLSLGQFCLVLLYKVEVGVDEIVN